MFTLLSLLTLNDTFIQLSVLPSGKTELLDNLGKRLCTNTLMFASTFKIIMNT